MIWRNVYSKKKPTDKRPIVKMFEILFDKKFADVSHIGNGNDNDGGITYGLIAMIDSRGYQSYDVRFCGDFEIEACSYKIENGLRDFKKQRVGFLKYLKIYKMSISLNAITFKSYYTGLGKLIVRIFKNVAFDAFLKCY